MAAAVAKKNIYLTVGWAFYTTALGIVYDFNCSIWTVGGLDRTMQARNQRRRLVFHCFRTSGKV